MASQPEIQVGSRTTALAQMGGGGTVASDWVITDVTDNTFTSQATDGRFSKKLKAIFSPSLAWDDGGEQGTSVVDWEIGSLWPLKTGNKAYYHRVVTMANGAVHEENWRCEVEAPRLVRLASMNQLLLAYKIVCVTDTNTHTWYWVDGMESPLKYVRSSSVDGAIYEEIEASIGQI